MGVTEKFANWIVSTQYEDIPANGIDMVKRSVLDWIGCALAGSARPAVRIVVDFTREQGGTHQARLLATGDRTTSINAAFANGVMGHIEDFDDSGKNHQASFLTPTVLALGEELHLSGKQVLAAWAIGYDITTRIGDYMRPDRAWHKTAIFGTIGATVVASKLIGLNTHQTRMALGIGASEAAGVMRNFGTPTKAFHPGNAARSGIVAAKLAARGFTADPDIIEARYGYADCFGGDGCYLPAMTQFLGDVFLVTSSPPGIKAWPCCASTHKPLTGILSLLQKHDINADDVLRVEHYDAIMPHTASLQRDGVRNGLEGKFSMEYTIAAAFLDKKIDLSTFSDERVKRGDIQAFMKRIHRYQDAEAALHSGRTKAGLDCARLLVFLRNDTVHDLKLGPRSTLTGEAVVEKFRANAGLVLSAEVSKRVISLVTTLDQLADTNELMDTITAECGKSTGH